VTQSDRDNRADRLTNACGFERGLTAGFAVFVCVFFYRLLIDRSNADPAANITRARFDQDLFHLPVIREFATQLPAPDLSNYASATTPGYHLVFAAIVRLFDPSVQSLRVYSSMLSGMLILFVFGLALAWRQSRRVDANFSLRTDIATAFVIALPLLASSYVIQSAMYLLPDNAAWLLVLITLQLALGLASTRTSARALITASIVLTLLVFTRQIHIWAAAPIWVGALVSAAATRRSTPDNTAPSDASSATTRTEVALSDLLCAIISRPVILSILATLPAFALLAYFIQLWGGIAPPMFRAATNPAAASGTANATSVTGISPATPVLILALVGIFGTFYLGWILSESLNRATGFLRRIDALIETVKASAIGASVAGVIAIIPPTTWSTPTRKGALWEIARKFEGGGSLAGIPLPRLVIADHVNLVMWLLAVLGGGILGLLWRAVDTRSRWVLATALLAFTAAQSAQALSWQRYVEPFILIWLVLCVTNLRPQPDGPPLWPGLARWAWLGPVVLAVMLGAITWAAFGS